MTDAPEYFVARDRARRLAWHLERVLQERNLAWQGAEIGLSSLVDEADLTLVEIAQDARLSAAGVDAGTLKDRERPYMEVPFVVALTSVAYRVETAAAQEAARRTRRASEEDGRREVGGEIRAALERIAAFSAAYDAKRPLPVARAVDLGRLLTRVGPAVLVESQAPPPTILSDPHAVEDLLLAIRAAVGEDDEPWRVQPAAAGRFLALEHGRAEDGDAPVAAPPDVERAALVLATLHPVEIVARGLPSLTGSTTLTTLRVEMGDAVGRTLPAALEIAVGGEAALSPAADRAFRALLAAPPLAEGEGPVTPPPARLVAVLGLLRVLDAEVPPRVAKAASTPAARRVASTLPRDSTRKAPIKRAFLAALEAEFPGLPVSHVGALAERVAAGKLRARDLPPAEMALLLAVFGRIANVGGTRLERVLVLAPLTDAEVDTTVRDLLDIAPALRELEAGRDLTATYWNRLERAVVAVLGRTGRCLESGG